MVNARRVFGSLAAASLIVSSLFTPAFAQSASEVAGQTVESSGGTNGTEADFWFKSAEGMRTFDVEENVLVPHLLEGDTIEIEGDLINAYNAKGELVASIKATLPQGIALGYDGEVIYASSADGVANRCIENKWVSLGINTAADLLVCAPLGLATGGVGGAACGAATSLGVTAASC